MTMPQAATHKWKTRVQGFEKSAAVKVWDIPPVDSVKVGEEWRLEMERRRWVLEDTYNKIVETHSDPEVEEEDLREEQVQDTYSIQRNLMDKAAISYMNCTMAIASRVGQLKAAARGIRSGPTNAQKAAVLVSKWARVYTDTKKRLDKLALEVTAELPVDHLAVANSLKDELTRINL